MCVLIWDEISLQPQLQYDKINDKIVGFEDWGHKRTQQIADHALVFMLRGIKSSWKIPLSYNFCKSQTKNTQLIRCIKEIVKEIAQAEFTVVAIICDQGSSNVSALNELLRNTKDILAFRLSRLTRERASWDVLETAYQLDIHSNTLNRQLKKLTDEHIIRSKIKKMKVKLATQVFSATLSAFIEYNSRIKGFVNTNIGPLQIPEEEGLATAKVLDFFNKLFDSINGLQLRSDTPLRVAVKENSKHHSFWYDAIKFLENMRFIHKTTKKPMSVPSLKHWITTIKGFQKLWATVNKAGMKYLKTRYINQDPLENFFGMIRSHNNRNINPTCANFESSFKTLLINNLTSKRTVGGNCELDSDGKALFSLQHFVESSVEMLHTSSDTNLVDEVAEIDNTSVSMQNKD
ncbi:PREDICTED: uncharacterized protein LOC105569228, partial [Vollenhovia emeryi]|uniref:uncharacterized protein LOC105569228 n=1 Tax=Vollenhovia emeryi TaxID=411798 RepID=UPI0005F54FB1